MDQVRDFREALPTLEIRTIFDIGANVGKTAIALSEAYPKATLHAFEPVEGTFELLKKAVGNDARIKCLRMAFGDVKGTVRMEGGAGSVKSKISTNAKGPEVEVQRGDEFCAAKGIDGINFLKIDTEGYDLKVCRGFESMLKARKIDLVQVESGLNANNKLHVPFQSFTDYFGALGYSLFRIYEQAGRPVVRRCDAVFVSPVIVERNLRKNLMKAASRGNPAKGDTLAKL